MLIGLSSSPVGADDQILEIPLCRALTIVAPYDELPIVVSGFYLGDRMYDPHEPICRFGVQPSTCVELPPSLAVPAGFNDLREEYVLTSVTFRGRLVGPQPSWTETEDSTTGSEGGDILCTD
jgi:hypothetical protein